MKRLAIIILLLMAVNFSIFAQFENTLYYMDLPQATYQNPARQNNCSFYLGLPVMSSFYTEYKNTGFRYGDLFDYNSYTFNEQDTSFRADLNKLYNSLNDLNYLMLNLKLNIFNTAFWVKDFYITFDVYTNYNQIFRYPKSIFLIKDGNYFEDKDKYISFTNMGFDLNFYNEYALGISKEVIDGLYVGGKLKLYQGFINVNTKDFVLDWRVKQTTESDSNAYDYIFTTSFDIEMANSDKFTNEPIIFAPEDFQPAFFSDFSNLGLGVDLGVIYKYQKFEVSASVIDLGFISWKDNGVNLKVENPADFVFSGADVGKYITNYSIAVALKDEHIRDSIINMAKEDFFDTLNQQVSVDTITQYKYKTGVNTKLHFGLAYQPFNWLKTGFYYSGMFVHKKLLSSYTFSANTYFWNGWGVSLSYTMFRKTFNNIGLGIAYKLGPFQFYLNTDNIAPYNFALRYATAYDKPFDQGVGTKWIKSSRLYNFHFGLNFVFGCKDRRDYGLLDDFDL